MCDPQMAMTALKVGGTIMEQRKKEEEAQRIAQESKDAYFMKSKQSNLRVLQEQNKASKAKQDADLKAMKSQGTALAVAGGSGVQGNNVSQLINDFERSEGIYNDRTDQRLEDIQQQTAMNQLGYQSESISRINSMQPVGFAETLFAVAEPFADFGVSYFDTKARYASLEG